MRQIFTLLLLLSAGFLSAQTPRLVVPMGHTSYIYSVAFSPDGKYILTGSKNGTAKLWDLSGHEILSLKGHDFAINSVAFSPNGQYILTSSDDKTAKLWDLSGQEIMVFAGHNAYVKSAVFSPDGKYVLTGSHDETAKLWDLKGHEIQTFKGHSSRITSVTFSPDSKFVLTGSWDNTAKLWDLNGGEIHTFIGSKNTTISAVAFTPDGKNVLTCDGTIKLWNLSGRIINSFKNPARSFSTMALSPDGKYVLTGTQEGGVSLWDLSGNLIKVLISEGSPVSSVSFSANSQYILTGSWDRTAKLWDLSGTEIFTFGSSDKYIWSVAFSPDGKQLVTGCADQTAKLWNLSGRGMKSLSGHESMVLSVAFSPACPDDPNGGKYLLTGSNDKTAKLWDLSGHLIQIFKGHTLPVTSVAFSPDGKYVVTASEDHTAKCWDLAGHLIQTFKGHTDAVRFVAISPNSENILTGSKDRTAKLWTLDGKLVQEFRGHTKDVRSLAFSPEGDLVLSGSLDGTAKLWDLSGHEIQNFSAQGSPVWSVDFWPIIPKDSVGSKYALTSHRDKTVKLWDLSGHEIRTFLGHTSYVESVTFSPDGNYILTGSADGTAKLWDTHSGKELVTLIAFDSTDWVVTTPSGLFDASPGAMKLMYYVQGLEVIGLDQLKTRYYEPYLLQKVMGFLPGGLRSVNELNDVPLYPEILEAFIKDDLLKVRLKVRSGGLGKVALELDGIELLADANPGRLTDFEVDLKPFLGYFSPIKSNKLSLKLYNEAGWLESQSYVLQHSYDGVASRDPTNPEKPRKSLNDLTDAALEKVHFYALVVGTSKYRDTTLNLKYPEKDAAIFADALRKAGGKLFKDRVEVQMLSTDREPWPRKAAIQKALRDIASKAGPDDILLVYFSGHGITYPPVSEDGQFYYLSTDIAGDNLKDEAILKAQAIAQDSLMEWVRQIKARKRILIYDACNSGSVVAQMEHGAKELNTDQRRALERMKDRSGMYVLAGSAANKSSFEASNYGHGLLTYSLLNGMLSVAAQNNGAVELGDLFAFVEDDVERLAKNINREQRPEVIKAESYPIGIIDKDTDIKMPTELPIFVRVNMMDSQKDKDLIRLSKAFNSELERLSGDKNPALVFWDVEAWEGKYYYLGGQYQSEGGNITGNVSLYRQDTKLTTFPISGSVDGLKKMVKDLVFEVRAYLEKN